MSFMTPKKPIIFQFDPRNLNWVDPSKEVPLWKRKPLLRNHSLVGFHVKFRGIISKKGAESSCPSVHKKA